VLLRGEDAVDVSSTVLRGAEFSTSVGSVGRLD
jgi:hypothetical protein